MAKESDLTCSYRSAQTCAHEVDYVSGGYTFYLWTVQKFTHLLHK
jgi:hypothetical protein